VTQYWVGVASRDHVVAAVRGGFCQVNYGKEAPVKRLRLGDRLVYYSPKTRMRAGDPLQAFTAIGEIADKEPHRVRVSDTFQPFRRQVRYQDSREAPLHPLLGRLTFSTASEAWGQVLRRGFFAIEHDDYLAIVQEMDVSPE
jgi:hypothetical protein